MTLMPAIVECLSAAILREVHQPSVGLALWQRPARAALHRAIESVLAAGPFCHVAEGRPAVAVRTLQAALPALARPLLADVLILGRLFATIADAPAVRLRLEVLADNSCSRHHVDAVGLRLLCTYAGLGTEWIGEDGGARHMRPFAVGLFKGTAFPDTAPRVLHRSPPVEHLPPLRRPRLLLCIDQPGVF